ncbi:MAG TPA: EAL domain-containing protein [Thermoanaerobaculia bacterium]|nr:EAL domain-containing protein [Thermoanaerobaculia bacterium]
MTPLAAGPDLPFVLPLAVVLGSAMIVSVVACWRLARRARGAELRLRESERRHRALVEDNGVGFWQVSPGGKTIYINPAMREMLEIESADEIKGESYDRFFTPESVAIIQEERLTREQGTVSSYEVDLVGRRGGRRHLMISGAPIFSETGEMQSLIGTCLDLTKRRDAEKALRDTEARLRLVIDQLPAVLWSTDLELRLTLAMGAGLADLSLRPNRLLGQDLFTFFQTRDADSSPIAAHRRALEGESVSYEQVWDGKLYRSYVEPLRDAGGAVVGCLGFALDISDQRRHEAQLTHLADHDPLTDLFNRRRFEEELKLQLSQARRFNLSGALLWCDVDRFKNVNDSLGHRAGDELLVKLAASLREQVRETDVLARLAGDEFAVLLPHTLRDEAEALARRLLEAVHGNTVNVGGKPIRTTASIGIALFPEHGLSSEELLARADLAMAQAKQEGRNRFLLFSGERDWQTQLSADMERAERLREAIENDELLIHLQPVIEVASGKVARCELLLRLRGEEGVALPPETFLGIAERFGILRDIDRWVVKQAIRLISDEERRGRRLHLDVNLSGGAFADPTLLSWIENELAAAGILPSCLALEITETAAVTDLGQARKFIDRLRRLGCQFAVDDFGVGFSSFHYLKQLPVDLLKIDGSFIHNLPRDPVNQNLVRAIVEMARSLGVLTVAEYVGDDETLEWLRLHGVDYAQGYHLGRPRPASELLDETLPAPPAAVAAAHLPPADPGR